ncbi:glycoside hydrolase family 72 protein [Polychaeton citri CBS 116435]|uniref:1,3-beta-glucanosyltransferase n=1 Tax=Polychaeton citri CBS 116435 TaxID=1314669 RepID=A0A9P4Q630_9PEZI|nr:glycoside hydrolase family 72 protein [Polychaeton citri CBS 116435]
MLSCSILILALLAEASLAIAPISVKGSKLFYSDSGDQYFIKGVAYQLTEDDPLAQPEQCKLDAALMKDLGANAIRVYHVEPSADHDECMSTFADNGIYAWIDLDTFDTYITGGSPAWTQSMHDSYAEVMDAFHDYDNVAGFFVGNEQLTTGPDSQAAPYLKAAARDMKAYRDKQGYREIPIGYSAADVPALRPNLQNYLACGDDPSEALDFYALNAYEWCGDNTFEGSGYNMLQENASDYNIPIFMSETGCIKPPPRYFQDQAALLGDDMDNTWSGVIVYEWIQETNSYGLISYGPPAPSDAPATGGIVDGFTRSGTPIPISPDFTNLQNQWKTLTPSGINSNDYSPSNSPVACPAYTSGAWVVSPDTPLPTLGQEAVAQSSSASTTSEGSSTGSSSATSGATASVTSSVTSSITGSSTLNTGSAASQITSSAPSSSTTDSAGNGVAGNGKSLKKAVVGLAGAGAFFFVAL